MNKKDYFELVDRELAAIKDTIHRKNNDYTGDADDAFANFKVTEALGLSDARTGLLIRMVDKIQRLKTFIAKGELKVKGESAQDAARDCIGYSLILLGMLEEGNSNKANPVEAVPIKIEAGKSYRRRDGGLERGMKEVFGLTCQAFQASSTNAEYGRITYKEDGTWLFGTGDSRRDDLVEEVKV